MKKKKTEHIKVFGLSLICARKSKVISLSPTRQSFDKSA